jgi:hypothetical protein
MNLQQIKDLAQELLKTAQALLKKDHYFYPALYSIKKNKIVDISIKEDGGEIETISSLMVDMAPTSDAFIALLEVDGLEGTDAEIVAGIDLKGHPEAYRALVAFVYTKDTSEMLQVHFVECEGEYTFLQNEGWMTPTPVIYKGAKLLSNPFQL